MLVRLPADGNYTGIIERWNGGVVESPIILVFQQHVRQQQAFWRIKNSITNIKLQSKLSIKALYLDDYEFFRDTKWLCVAKFQEKINIFESK